MMVTNGQCSYSEISCIGTLVKGKMQIGKVLTKLSAKPRLETCGLHHRSPSLILTLLLVLYQTTAGSYWKKENDLHLLQCIQHWRDECQKLPTVTARKEKIKGHCFICLKQGHQQKKKCTVKKACVYCKQRNRQHIQKSLHQEVSR